MSTSSQTEQSPTKQRWARLADQHEARAQKLQAQAAALNARRPGEDDYAFLTQPGRIVARDRMHARLDRAAGLARDAERAEAKARSLHAMASREAGTAARERADKIAACDVAVGDLVDTTFFGVRRVVKVNRLTVLVEASGPGLKVEKSFVRVVQAGG